MRIGYARASTARQSPDAQADSLKAAGVTKVFAEKISTRAATRPELDKAVALARGIRTSGAAVTLVVHEHKRLGRGLELAALAEQLRAAGIGEQLPNDTAVGCRRTRICGYARNVPRDAATVICPRCETRQPPAHISN